MGFRLAPSNMTLDNPKGSKVNVKIFDSKYLQNGSYLENDRYEVGPTEAVAYLKRAMGHRAMTPKIFGA